MLTKLIIYTLGSSLALFVAAEYVPGVTHTGTWTILAMAGFAIALLNLAIAPILRILALPLRILTFNLFSLVIDMAMVWLADILLVDNFNIEGLVALFWTTVIIMIFNALLWQILSPARN